MSPVARFSRRHSQLLVVVLAAGVLLAIRLRQDHTETRRDPVTTSSIVLLGDSLTEGGDWARLLPDHRVANRGYSGFTSEEILDPAADVAASRPQAVLIMIGTNDIRDGRPPSWTVEHLDRMLDRFACESPDSTVVLQTVLPRSDAVAEVRALNQAIVELASSRRTVLFDVYPHFDDGAGGLRDGETTDGVHLTEAGYVRWATILDEFIDDGLGPRSAARGESSSLPGVAPGRSGSESADRPSCRTTTT
jgi:lysophospholipase L1-like esterase